MTLKPMVEERKKVQGFWMEEWRCALPVVGEWVVMWIVGLGRLEGRVVVVVVDIFLVLMQGWLVVRGVGGRRWDFDVEAGEYLLT